MIRISSVARKQGISDIIKNQREMDGGENPHAKTERKKGEFLYHFGHFVIRQDFVIKIGSSRKKWGNFSHPPTPCCAPERAALIRPRSGGSRGDQGLSFFFSDPLRWPSNSNFPEIRYSGKNFDHRRISNF